MSAPRVLVSIVIAALSVAPVPAMAAPGTSRSPSSESQVQRSGPGAIELVFDTSGSMKETDSAGAVKIEGAKSAILNFIASVEPSTRLGLWTYPFNGSDCGAGSQQIPVAKANGAAMSATVRTLTAVGGTPTGEALAAAADTLGKDGGDGTIILVSDGHHTCSADPCAAAKKITDSGQQIQVITVGFRVDDEGAKELSCIADAAHGRYIGVTDNRQLIDQLNDLTRPHLAVTLLPAEQRVIADVGTGGGGLVTITARVTNASDVEARDVEAALDIIRDPDAPAGQNPGISPALIQQVGNITRTQTTTQVVWTFRAGLILAGKTVRYQVLVRAVNSTTDVFAPGTVEVVDGNTLHDAGQVLREATKLAIMGDSYSAGEGSGDYVKGTDTPDNSCHRSAHTYLLPLYEADGSFNLACSGAVTADLTGPNKGNGEPAQVVKLALLQNKEGPLDAVALTSGGNDVHFADILKSCLIFPSCNNTIYTLGLKLPKDSQEYLDEYFQPLPDALENAYAAINAVLNSDDAVAKRGHLAPIIVPAYPRVLPGADRGACLSLPSIGQGELDFGSELVTRLNLVVSGAVHDANYQGIPVFFVPQTEDAFLPDHTLCDRDPYARGIDKLREAEPSLAEQLTIDVADATGTGVGRAAALYVKFQALGRRLQELFHPNLDGYKALTRGLIRWSNTDDGRAAYHPVSHQPPGPKLIVTDGPPTQTITVEGGRADLTTGGIYTVVGTGYLQGSPISVNLQSSPIALAETYAGDDGTARASIAIPRNAPTGNHEIVIMGTDPQGDAHVVRIGVHVSEPPSPPWSAVFVLVSLVLALAGGGLLLFMREARSRGIATRRSSLGSLPT
ncbi:MAG: Ca-activated chloride channel [Acidimicrobiaceae bacterium]|jgi:Mg-chelatase subunit ChlD/lysophospholipase L1-like esterase